MRKGEKGQSSEDNMCLKNLHLWGASSGGSVAIWSRLGAVCLEASRSHVRELVCKYIGVSRKPSPKPRRRGEGERRGGEEGGGKGSSLKQERPKGWRDSNAIMLASPMYAVLAGASPQPTASSDDEDDDADDDDHDDDDEDDDEGRKRRRRMRRRR